MTTDLSPAAYEARLKVIAESQLPGMGAQLGVDDHAAGRFAVARALHSMARAWNYYSGPLASPLRLHEVDRAPVEVAIARIEAAHVFNEGLNLLEATRFTAAVERDLLVECRAIGAWLFREAERAHAYLVRVHDATAGYVADQDAFARQAIQAVRDSARKEDAHG